MTAPRYRIMTVCTGNICRSPMAEFILREALTDAGLDHLVTVDSAGVSDEEAGHPADPRTLAALRRRGHTDTGWAAHVARQVEPAWIRERDLVLAATHLHARRLRGLVDPGHHEKIRLIREYDPAAVRAGDLEMGDPWYGGSDSFDRTYEEVVAAVPGIVEHVRAQLRVTP